jgi:bifunctional DNA-binding transcriptional regulator/antitoxin component of YhaV-PrlF toxin-antitoxin module
LCTRKADELGRIVLPLEARIACGVREEQNFDVYLDEYMILLKPNHDIPACHLCGESGERLEEAGHFLICGNCIIEISALQK